MYADNGFEKIEHFADASVLLSLKDAVSELPKTNRSGGVRSIERFSEGLRAYVESAQILDFVKSYIGGCPKLARAIYFNKTENQNWLVSWHQDKTTAVSDKVDCSTWSNWSVKNNVIHAQPPLEAYNKMLTIRLHLDDTDASNGCLKVISGSHLLGVLPQQDISRHTDNKSETVCAAKAGDALLMHPLLIHSSSKATSPSSRRIIHMEYSSFELPKNIQWA